MPLKSFIVKAPDDKASVYVTDSDKHSCLLQFKIIYARKRFIVKAPDDKA